MLGARTTPATDGSAGQTIGEGVAQRPKDTLICSRFARCMVPPHELMLYHLASGLGRFGSKLNFKPNCTLRGFTAPPTAPKLPEPAVRLALPRPPNTKFARLKMLNMSAWNIRFMPSLGNLKTLRSERSVAKKPGPRTLPTPLVPGLVGDGLAKAAGLNHLEGPRVGTVMDWPVTRFARRPFTLVPFPSAALARTVMGCPDCALVMPLSSQPPIAAPMNPLRFRKSGEAYTYVTARISLRSKSATP